MPKKRNRQERLKGYPYWTMGTLGILSFIVFFPETPTFSMEYIMVVIGVFSLDLIFWQIGSIHFWRQLEYGSRIPELDALLIAPVLEELVFRNLIFGIFGVNPWSIVGSTLLFTLAHKTSYVSKEKKADVKKILFLTIEGFLFGAAFIASSSVYGAMLVHALNNATTFLLPKKRRLRRNRQ